MLERLEAGRNGGELFLPGPRGLGKTSLLVETGREARRRGITVVRVELARTADESMALLVAAFAEAMGRAGIQDLARRVTGLRVGPLGVDWTPAAPGPGVDPATGAPASATTLVLEAARACADDGGLLVLVDEAQEHAPTAAAVVRAAHRASQDALAFGTVLAGLPGAIAGVTAEVSYAERIPTTPLGALDPDDTFRALVTPLQAQGVVLPATRAAHAFTLTGGYPFFVQVLGRQLWVAADATDHISTPAWTMAATATAARTDRWLADRFARVPPALQRYLRAANVVGWPARTGAIAQHLDTTHSSLSPARAALIDDGLLWVPTRGQVALVIPAFAPWLDRLGADD